MGHRGRRAGTSPSRPAGRDAGNTKSLTPTFFVVGGPKCGTTSLAQYLGAHPQVFMCTPKEPTFFNSDFTNRYTTSLEDYVGYFRDVPRPVRVAGEASPLYLASEVAAANILAFEPSAKFIAMVRNPLEMAPSLHSQKLRDGIEVIDRFEAAWQAQKERAQGGRVPAGCRDVRVLLYGPMCRLGEQVDRLLATAGAERVHVVVFDDLCADPRAVYRATLAFLGVDDDGREDFEVYNANTGPRSMVLRRVHRSVNRVKHRLGITAGFGLNKWLARYNTVLQARAALPPALRREMVAYFRADVERLEIVLGRPLAEAWLGPR